MDKKIRPPLRQTHTYSTMEVSEATYNEIRNNFVDLGPEYIHHYIDNYQKEDEAIVMGTVGLVKRRVPVPLPEEHRRAIFDYKYNPAHPIGTCIQCGKEMVYNVPRLGASGGFVHKETNTLEC